MTRVTELETSNLTLNQKMSDLTQNLEDTNSAHRAQLAAKDNEIKRLLDELSRQLEEYQNLMDTKIGLDMEIAVFRRLLESEEDRLGISIDEGGKIHGTKAKEINKLFTIVDDFDAGEVVAHSSPEIVRTVTTNSETNFQRKITVSQTQL